MGAFEDLWVVFFGQFIIFLPVNADFTGGKSSTVLLCYGQKHIGALENIDTLVGTFHFQIMLCVDI